MKKLTSKEAKPAAKSVPAAAPVAPKSKAAPKAAQPKKETVAVKKVAPVSKKAAVAAPAPEAPKPVKVPAVKPPVAEAKPVVYTTLIAQVDVGFGNSLYVRGEGAGLSWDKGIAMENVSSDEWKLVINGGNAPVVFKFLVNDERWSTGDDFVAVAGSTASLVPAF